MCPLMQETRTNQNVQFCFIVVRVSAISNLGKVTLSYVGSSSVTRLVSMEAEGAPFTPFPPRQCCVLRVFKAIAARIRGKSKQTLKSPSIEPGTSCWESRALTNWATPPPVVWRYSGLKWIQLQNHDSRQDVSTLLPSAFFGLLQAVHSDCPGCFHKVVI